MEFISKGADTKVIFKEVNETQFNANVNVLLIILYNAKISFNLYGTFLRRRVKQELGYEMLLRKIISLIV